MTVREIAKRLSSDRMFKIAGFCIAVGAILIQQGRQLQKQDELNETVKMLVAEISVMKIQSVRQEQQIEAMGETLYKHLSWGEAQRDRFNERIGRIERLEGVK